MKNEAFRGITLQQMEALICIIEERTFGGAARKMSLTQPSLTKHIKNVEELLGGKDPQPAKPRHHPHAGGGDFSMITRSGS